MTSIRDPRFGQDLLEACHDMRQPVACVLALAAAALAEPGLPVAMRARLESIVEQAQWLADVISYRLLSDAHPGGGARRADVARVVKDAVAAEVTTWPGTLRVTASPEPILGAVHPVALRRMVANLIGNATRAAGRKGTVNIVIERRGDRALITVEDSGPGFGNIQRSSGLGLSSVARELSSVDGRIEFGQCSLGGTRARLWLPRPEPPKHKDPGRLWPQP